jgi:hypothetical protein
MLVICDVNEYRKCVKEEMRIPILTQLFGRLHALCNLLVVVPENLKVVRNDEQLVSGIVHSQVFRCERSLWNMHFTSLHHHQTTALFAYHIYGIKRVISTVIVQCEA